MSRNEPTRSRFWPAIVAPVGLLFLFALAAWLFAEKVERDNVHADLANRRLESYARREASEIAVAARDAAGEFVGARRAARRQLEANLRLEAKGVMDSVCRLLTATMENNRRRTAVRRDNVNFPSGFEGVGRFLEVMPRAEVGDSAKAALEAGSPELAALLPAGFGLVVVEDHAREMLSVGATGGGEGGLTASATRDLVFNDGQNERRWTLRLEVASPDPHPEPTAGEVAELLGRRFGSVRPDGVFWRGWLLGEHGGMAGSFPAEASSAGHAPPYLEPAGEWKLLDGGELVWLEKAPAANPALPWTIGVSASIPAPPPESTYFDALFADFSWAATLGGLALVALTAWIWFLKGVFQHPEEVPVAPARQAEKPLRRLVRDPDLGRSVGENEEIIVADIGRDGLVKLSAPPARPAIRAPSPPPSAMPKGSLGRLQAMHRGKAAGGGSRILDQAKSPLLREMARRVRPQAKTAMRN